MSRDTTIFPCRTGPMDREVVVESDQSPESEVPRAAAAERRPLEKRTVGLRKSGIDLVEEACRRMGKAPEEEAPWRQYLKDQWLDGRGALASLSEAEWAKLEIPIGLRSELRKFRNFESPSWGGVDFSNKLTVVHGKKEMN
ncbi:hypothetical protein FOZ63_028618, partial [Perkinsus olseni]